MLKIIIVDDEPLFRQYFVQSTEWEKFGFEVCCEAKDGLDALEKIKTCKPDVAFVDINMPFMNGLELIEKLQIQYPEIVAVLVTGYSEFDYARKGIQLGVLDYILKPFNDEELGATLAKIKKRMSKDNQEVITDDAERDIVVLTKAKLLATKAKEYIDANLQDSEMNVTKISNHFYVHSSYLRRVFKNEVGKTVSNYITDTRMQKAMELLTASNDTAISTVAEKVGYSDCGYFIKCFKKYAGISPGKYGNSNR